MLNLKGFRVFKSKSTKECLSILNQSEEKLDIVLIDKQSADENNFFLLNEINRITRDTMIVVIVDTDDDQQKLRKNAVEFIT